ncbi:MAG TPA: methyl-accepting chemotaxis protein, partial [Peptococcaceae bacterium]|nr:methyl-accepting chemotaxis protein [Peptococcaceae bacterium]
MSNNSDSRGASLRFKVLLVSGLITLIVVMAVFVGSFFAAKNRLLQHANEQVNSFAGSLKDTLELQVTLFQDRNTSNLSIALNQLPGERVMESVNRVEVGE